jgi:hypothetical protein
MHTTARTPKLFSLRFGIYYPIKVMSLCFGLYRVVSEADLSYYRGAVHRKYYI